MAGNVELNDQGMRRMILALQAKTGASYRDIVRGISADVINAAARGTRSTTPEKMRESVKKLFRKPLRLASGDRVGIAKSGKVWVCLAGWNPSQNWVLVSSNGELEMPGDRVWRTKEGARVSRVKLSPQLQGRIQAAISQAMEVWTQENRYRAGVVALGRAGWIEMLRRLNLPIAGGRKIAEAQRIRIPGTVSSAIHASERGSAKDFTIRIENNVQAALNDNARGTRAFRLAVNGQVRRFERAVQTDLAAYTRRFARRNGFTVQSGL